MESLMDANPPARLNLPLSGETNPSHTPPAGSPPVGDSLEEQVTSVLRTCYDPEIPVNIYELGLIYDVKVDPAAGTVAVKMTLTSPACPVAGALPGEVRSRIETIPGVSKATVDLVWDPPWDKSRMSEEAALQLGLFD
jgi:FeS assembly SUF system protein